MRRLIILLLVALAAWYGYKHYPDILQKRAGHEAVIENSSGHPMDRVRLIVDGQTFVKENLADGEKAVFAFKVANDASFRLEWNFTDQLGQKQWSGGLVPKGPMLQRHIMTVDADAEVLYRAENK
jgi:hypothetical protein